MEGAANTPPPPGPTPAKKPGANRVKKWQNSWRRQRTVPTQSTEATSTVNFMSQWINLALPSLPCCRFLIYLKSLMLQICCKVILQQYSKTKDFSPTVLNTLHGTHHISMCIMISPTVLEITLHSTQDNPHSTHNIPHGTEHPPRYSRYPPHLSWYPPRYWTPPRYSRYPLTILMISPTVLHTHYTGWLRSLHVRAIFWKQFLAACSHKGWTALYALVVPSLSTKFIKNSQQNCQFSQYLGT